MIDTLVYLNDQALTFYRANGSQSILVQDDTQIDGLLKQSESSSFHSLQFDQIDSSDTHAQIQRLKDIITAQKTQLKKRDINLNHKSEQISEL